MVSSADRISRAACSRSPAAFSRSLVQGSPSAGAGTAWPVSMSTGSFPSRTRSIESAVQSRHLQILAAVTGLGQDFSPSTFVQVAMDTPALLAAAAPLSSNCVRRLRTYRARRAIAAGSTIAKPTLSVHCEVIGRHSMRVMPGHHRTNDVLLYSPNTHEQVNIGAYRIVDRCA